MGRQYKIGMVGLGKLGLPVALAMSLKGHDVMGYDLDSSKMQKHNFGHQEKGPNGEPSIELLLQQSTLKFGSLSEIVAHSEIIFVAVQTPHQPEFEGITRLPDERADFDYEWLRKAMISLSLIIAERGEDKIVVIISTVLPGTLRREIMPYLSDRIHLLYNPFFIAMGTTMQDFLNPDFIVIGRDEPYVAAMLYEFYEDLLGKYSYQTTIENVELIKVAYNTYISMKICFANTLMEICHKSKGCNIDTITQALSLCTDRLMSPKYLKGGMGDGGGCHPRDNIAMSWMAQSLDLSYDWFEGLMLCREKQTEWLADLVEEESKKYDHKIVYIYGKAFKPETNLTVGSPALLLGNILKERGFRVIAYDPHTLDGYDYPIPKLVQAVYFIGTKHKVFEKYKFVPGSTVIDPWRYIPNQDGIKVVRVGVGDHA